LVFCPGIYRQSNEHGKQRWHAAGKVYETAALRSWKFNTDG
jgi:hypothetical protein